MGSATVGDALHCPLPRRFYNLMAPASVQTASVSYMKPAWSWEFHWQHTKCMGPSTCLVFEIDIIAMELRLPQEKLSKLKGLLSEWQYKKVCSREKLESLLGHLNHACSVVRPGRSFIGRLISLLTEAKRKHRNISRINSEARSDVRWWHMFFEQHTHPVTTSFSSPRP